MTPDQLLELLDQFGDAHAVALVEQVDAADAREADARRPIVEAFERLIAERDEMRTLIRQAYGAGDDAWTVVANSRWVR